MPRSNRNNIKVVAVFVAIVGLGVALSLFTYVRGKSVNQITMELVTRDLPTFDGLANLKIAVVREHLTLYEYYATIDRNAFKAANKQNKKHVADGLELLNRAFPDRPEVAEVLARYQTISKLETELDATLDSGSVDWDRARLLLVQIDNHATVINRQIDALLISLRDTVYERSDVTQQEVAAMVGMVVGFSVAIAFLLALAGYSLRAYLAELRLRRQLALFPERNPHPILSASLDGTVVYANPGARTMLSELALSSSDAAQLLPPGFSDRLRDLRQSGKTLDSFEYETHQRILECQVHPLSDDGIFHVYLLDITARKQAEQRLIHQAYYDALTECPNRRKFEEMLSEALTRATPDSAGAVVLLAIDRFRLIIESYGRPMGDEIIKAAARRLETTLQERMSSLPDCTLYRMDGAQFAVLIPRLASPEALGAVTLALKERSSQPTRIRDREFFISFSAGASIFPRHGDDALTVIRNADNALEHAIKMGGNNYLQYAETFSVEAVEFLELEAELRHALERHELELFYQPQIDAATGHTTGFEALLRWNHPTHGLVLPGRFISVAEESGLIVPIGEWVLRSACAQARRWLDAGIRDFSVAVNVSARQFATEDISELVKRCLADSGLPSQFLEIEITEGIAMHDVERSIATLGALKKLGAGIAIDDFGTGYSSLSYLKRFPVDKLKIDQSFVHNMTMNENDAAITRAVIALAHSLKLNVIAEGVETEEQKRLLKEYGCDEIQGYLVGHPVAASELTAFLMTKRATRQAESPR